MLTGLISALIALAIIYGFVGLRPAPRIDADFGQHKTSFSVPMAPDDAFKAVEAMTRGASAYTLGRSDAARRRVILQQSPNMKTFGYFYPVDFAPSATGSDVTVGIKSKLPFQFGPFARRQNEGELATIVAALKAKLAA